MSLTLTGDGAIGSLSATEVGYLDGVTSGVQSQLDAKLNLAGGKILQIVRDTDTTTRSTTSTSSVDVTGMSVTITPQKSDSAVIIVGDFDVETTSAIDGANYAVFALTDNSNNVISSGGEYVLGVANLTGTGTRLTATHAHLWGYATPATTSAVTYKLRFRTDSASVTVSVANARTTGQLYAIEVSA